MLKQVGANHDYNCDTNLLRNNFILDEILCCEISGMETNGSCVGFKCVFYNLKTHIYIWS